MDSPDLFPPELIEEIFTYLSIDDLLSVSRVSVSWYIASNSSRLWRTAIIKQSFSRDRFIKLSDLDKFNGISSNYDGDYSFNVETSSSSRLPSMNPWKLSLCRHNFVERNLRGEKPNLKLARHKITLNDDMEILDMYVEFPSDAAQDGLYLPVLGRKPGEIKKDFHLIQLDGVPKIIRLFTTQAEIHHACIDRHGVVWLEDDKVNYLPLVENFNNSQIKNLGSSLIESGDKIFKFRDHLKLGMDAIHIAVQNKNRHVKIWCRKTCQFKTTISPERYNICNIRFKNGYLYLELLHCVLQVGRVGSVEMYDLEECKLISKVDFESLPLCTVFGVKYYAIVSSTILDSNFYAHITVREIKTNKVMFNETVRENRFRNTYRIWFVDDYLMIDDYHGDDLGIKVLNLVDWTVSDVLSFNHYYRMYLDWAVRDSCLLVILMNRVDVWDWKLGRKLQEIELPQTIPSLSAISHKFHVNEIRLMYVGKTSIDVVGFW